MSSDNRFSSMDLRARWAACFALCPVLALWVLVPEAQAAGRLRVASYNVWGLPSVLLKKPKRLPWIPSQVVEWDADVITFQETFHRRTSVLASIPGYPYFSYGPRAESGRTSSGLLTISRYPIKDRNEMRFSLCSGTDCLAHKGVLHTRIEVPGVGEVDLFTTHLNAAGGSALRSDQVRELREFVALHSGPRPLIVTGDFNFTMDSPPYNQMVRVGGFRDVHDEYRLAHPSLDPIQWEGYTFDPDRNSNLGSSSRLAGSKRIDYIWLRDATCVRTEIQSSRLVLDEPVEGQMLSDHFGVMADLEIDNGC